MWAGIKYALNGSLGNPNFNTLDERIDNGIEWLYYDLSDESSDVFVIRDLVQDLTTIYRQDQSFMQAKKIIIPPTVLKIDDYTFEDTAVSRIRLPVNLYHIGEGVFYNCQNLKSIVIPEKVEYIGDSCFANSGLYSIILPKSLKTIGNIAFKGCKRLHTIIYSGTMAEWGAINKGDEWSLNTDLNNVICKDGICDL